MGFAILGWSYRRSMHAVVVLTNERNPPPPHTHTTTNPYLELVERMVSKLCRCEEEALPHDADGGGGGEGVEILDPYLMD